MNIDEKSENLIDNAEINELMQPMMDLKVHTIKEERNSMIDRNGEEINPLKSLEETTLNRIHVSKKRSDLSQAMIETQGIASHLNLNDAATSPFIAPTPNAGTKNKDDTTNMDSTADMMVRGHRKKPAQKFVSTQGLNNVIEQLQNPKIVTSSSNQDHYTVEYKPANMRKLSISILTSNQIGSGEPPTALNKGS